MEKTSSNTRAHLEDIPPSKVDDSAELDDFDIVDESAIGGRDVSELPPKYYRSLQVIFSVIAFTLGVSCAQGSLVMISGAIFTYIDPDLGPSPNTLWVATAIPLAQSIAFPVVGRLSDIFGRRYFYLFGNLATLVGFIVGGQAKSIGALITSSVIIGLASVVQVTGSVIAGELFPNNRRYLVFAVVGAGLFPLTGLSPGIGRELCLNTAQGWRWIYHLFAIISAVILVLLFFGYHPPTFHKLHKNSSKLDALKHLDWIGAFLYAGSAATLLLGLTWGSGIYTWSSARVIAPTVVGIFGFVIFACWEYFGKPRHPFLPISLFANRNWILLSLISAFGGIPFYALNILLPQQLTTVVGTSLSTAGWAACTLPGGITLGFGLAGIVDPSRIARFGITIQRMIIVSCVVFTAFLGAMAMQDLTLTLAVVFTLIASIATGWFEALSIAGAPLELDPKDIGMANGAQYSLRTIFASIASAIYVTTLTNKVTSNVAARVPPAILGTGVSTSTAIALTHALASGNVTAVSSIPGVTPEAIAAGMSALKIALIRSYQTLYYISVAFGAAILILALALKSNLIQSRLTTEIPRRLQNVGQREVPDPETSPAN